MSVMAAPSAFPDLLKTWRQRRRYSQLDLALASNVSQRHVSFLESGRAQPSRNMVLHLCETLDVPLRERNTGLIAAGFAPVFRASGMDDPQMSQVMGAVRMMLNAHEPFPALALDRAWNIKMSNRPFEAMIAMLGADIWTRVGGESPNLMRLFFHPEGLRPSVANWSAVGPLVWQRAQREAAAFGDPKMKAVLDELEPHQDRDVLGAPPDVTLEPVLPFTMQVGDRRLSMFAIIATLGTAQDVTAEELRIETLYPADPATEALFRATPTSG